jgi:hypothetical protein
MKMEGFVVVYALLDAEAVAALCVAADELHAAHSRPPAGIREPTALHDAFHRAAKSDTVTSLAASLLDGPPRLVRSILFDKTPATNWDVVWHQDVTIAVKERIDVPGFGPWSTKQGVHHVQPPSRVLERMVTLRIHLDDCGPANGPLLVVPGSHANGFVDVRTLDVAKCERRAVACVVSAGDCVAMRPLILHASKKALEPAHRRVLHLEFACDDLPGGLAWTE